MKLRKITDGEPSIACSKTSVSISRTNRTEAAKGKYTFVIKGYALRYGIRLPLANLKWTVEVK